MNTHRHSQSSPATIWTLVPAFAALSVIVLFSTGCLISNVTGTVGSGTAVEEARETDSFTAISTRGSADLEVTIGEVQSIVVRGDDNIVPLIETRVEDGTLVIGSKASYSSRTSLKIMVVTPRLESVRLSGSGDVRVIGLDADSFAATLRGSGDVIASGRANSVNVEVYGSGDIDFRKLEAATGEASVTGSGDISVYTTESLRASVRGSGDIVFYGDPEDVVRNVWGSGDIRGR